MKITLAALLISLPLATLGALAAETTPPPVKADQIVILHAGGGSDRLFCTGGLVAATTDGVPAAVCVDAVPAR